MNIADELLAPASQEVTSPLTLKGAIDELAARLSAIDERRSGARYPFNVPITLFRKTGDGRMEEIGKAWGLNISTIGIGLLSRTNFPRNSHLYVDLRPLTGESLYAKVVIVHCSDPVDGIYRIGGYFDFCR